MQHPEVEEESFDRKAFLDGMLNFLFSTLLYSSFIWYAIRTLESAGAISFRFTWINSTSLVGFAMFCRIWDRVFIKK